MTFKSHLKNNGIKSRTYINKLLEGESLLNQFKGMAQRWLMLSTPSVYFISLFKAFVSHLSPTIVGIQVSQLMDYIATFLKTTT